MKKYSKVVYEIAVNIMAEDLMSQFPNMTREEIVNRYMTIIDKSVKKEKP